ncbi:MAG: hypothetical protein CMK09_07850 [Ponticaulis sp.]|nr:hypothetical protein [Ponticaulis sp.]
MKSQPRSYGSETPPSFSLNETFRLAVFVSRRAPVQIGIVLLVFGLLPSIFMDFVVLRIEHELIYALTDYGALSYTLYSLVYNTLIAPAFAAVTMIIYMIVRDKTAHTPSILIQTLLILPGLLIVSLIQQALTSIGSFFLVFPGLIFMTILAFAVPIFATRRSGIIDALSRSTAMTKGNRWKIFGLIVLTILIGALAAAGYWLVLDVLIPPAEVDAFSSPQQNWSWKDLLGYLAELISQWVYCVTLASAFILLMDNQKSDASVASTFD